MDHGEDNKTEKILEKIDVELTRLNLGSTYDSGYKMSLKSETQNYGICGMCKAAGFARTQYAVKFAFCRALEFKLTSGDPIVQCSSYDEKGRMTIRDMAEIAHIIEFCDKPIGFKRDGEE